MKCAPALFVGFLLLASPVFADTITDASKINGLKKGESTPTEVISALGKPEHEDHNPDGRSVFLYKCDLPTKNTGESFKGIIAVMFDASGHYAGIRVYRDNPK